MNTVLFIGPVPPPVFGEAVAFKAAFEGYGGRKYLVNKNNYTFGFVQKLWHYPKSIGLMLYYLIFKPIDVVYFSIARGRWSCLRDVLLIHFSAFAGKKIVAHLHGGDFDALLEKSPALWQYLLRKSYAKLHKTAVILPAIAQQFAMFRPQMAVVSLPNFYDPLFDEEPHTPKNEYITITFFSNLLLSKGIEVLLEAFGMVSEKQPRVVLQLAGTIMSDALGTAEKVAKILEKHTNSNPNIRYVGSVYGQQKVALLSSSDIFVLPSIMPEGQPISLLEAMRAGNAIVLSDVPFLAHCIESTQGIIAPKNNAPALAEALLSIVQNLTQLRAIQAQNSVFAQQHFAPSTYKTAIEALLNY